MTNSIRGRVREHKEEANDGFTKKYKINRLVYFERFQYVNNAISRETEIKKWRREKKVALIESENLTWEDLAEGWYN